jgi:hypothetical protein
MSELVTINVCFHRAKGAGAMSTLIDLLSGSRGFSHVEIQFSDGLSFSSDQFDGGTRYKRIEYTPERWEKIPLEITREQEAQMRAFCNREQQCPYDWRGILGFVLPWEKENPTKWFCSEVCLAALQLVGILLGLVPHKTSPNELYEKLLAYVNGLGQQKKAA